MTFKLPFQLLFLLVPAELWPCTEVFSESCRAGLGGWTATAGNHVLQ